MVKSNKKTFILIGVYTVILLAIAGAFLFVQKTSNDNATTPIYITTQTIQAGETVDDTLIANKLKKVEYPKAAVDEIELNGGSIVTSTAQISSLIAVGNIPAGQPVTKQLFEAIAPNVYGDYVNKTFGLSSGTEWRFETPNYIVLTVDETNTPINGFVKGDEISIEGYQKYTYKITNEDGSSQLAEGHYSGILTNHAVVHSLVFDEAGTLTNVGVIVEQSDYPIISTISKNGRLTFHTGYIQKWETTTEKETSDLLLGSGLTLEKLIEKGTILTYTNLDGVVVEEKLSDFTPNYDFDTEASVYPTFIQTLNSQADKQYDIKFETPYPVMKITHYNLDGSVGHYMDATALNTTKSYNSKTGIFTTVFKEAYAEGYYEMLLGTYADTTFTAYQKVCFVIEYNDYEYRNEDGSLKIDLDLNLNYLTEKDTYGETESDLKGLIDAALKDNPNYKGFEASNIFDKITATVTENEPKDNLWKKQIEFMSSDNTDYDVKLVYEKLDGSNDVYLYSYCEIISEVAYGTKIRVEKEVNSMYAKSAVKISKETKDGATVYYVKETNNYKTALYSVLATLNEEDKTVDVDGVYSKTYFENLLIRGINLNLEVSDLGNLKFENLFNEVDSYGSFGGQEIKGVNIIMDYGTETALKLQLFYSFESTRYYTDEATVESLASILNVDSKALYDVLGFVPGKNSTQVSKESVQTIIDNLLNEDVIEKLNDSESKGKTEDLLKLIGFIYTSSPIDFSNLQVKEVTTPSTIEGAEPRVDYYTMFNATDLVEFIESLKIEFVLENGESIITNVKINY